MFHKESVLPRNKDHGCYCGGIVNWRVRAVHWVAKIVGLHHQGRRHASRDGTQP